MENNSESLKLLEICSKKLEYESSNIKALIIRSSTYIKLGEYSKAESDALKLLKINPNLSMAYYLLGVINEKIKNRNTKRYIYKRRKYNISRRGLRCI